MTIIRRAIWMAAKRAAADPRVQAKAAEVVHEEIAPRVRTAIDVARPELQRAKENVQRAGQRIKKAVSERPEIRNAKNFLSALGKDPK